MDVEQEKGLLVGSESYENDDSKCRKGQTINIEKERGEKVERKEK